MKATERDIALELLSEAVREGDGSLRLQVRGVCMRPLVRDGDWVRCQPLDGSPRRGQLVLARDERNQLVCHRILGQHNGRFQLAGDRAFALEEHAPASILGRVTHIERPRSAAAPEGIVEPSVDLSRRGWLGTGIDRAFAAWHLFSHRHRQQGIGRILEGIRWRLVVLHHRWLWWRGRG